MSDRDGRATSGAAEMSLDPVDLCVPSDRGDTVATLLHDLNQPLTALTNFLAAAQVAVEQNAAPGTVADLVAAADAQAGRARAIVRRLREHLAH